MSTAAMRLGAAIQIALCAVVSGCGLCGNIEIARLTSPDGKLDAVLHERNCGATTDFSTQVAIVRAGQALPNSSANAFIATGGSVRAAWGGPPAEIEWRDADHLAVRYERGSELHRSEKSVRVSRWLLPFATVTVEYAAEDDIVTPAELVGQWRNAEGTW